MQNIPLYKKITLILFILLSSIVDTKAQAIPLSENAKISVLTIGQGSSISDAFGHNGFRIKSNTMDIVFDYGRYPFGDPNFILNFARGKLNYSQGYAPYEDIIFHYKNEDRTITEQFLNLTLAEKQHLFNILVEDSKPENKDYLYDFFYDNCATKIRDVTQNALNNSVTYTSPSGLQKMTFRDLIQAELQWNTWGSFGIDLALGAVIDKQAEPFHFMFLPKYIKSFFEIATFGSGNKKLVSNTIEIHKQQHKKNNVSFITSPFFVFLVLAVCILFITYKNYKNRTQSKWLDVTIFSITGLIGVFILLLWFATDHTATAQNYNLLWAFALNLFVVPQVIKKTPKTWFKKYLKFLIIALCLLTLHWCIGVQVFAYALIPLIIALAVRYVFLVWWQDKKVA